MYIYIYILVRVDNGFRLDEKELEGERLVTGGKVRVRYFVFVLGGG